MKIDPANAPKDEADNGGVIIYLSEAGGLTQLGAYLDRLMPGAVSSTRHWHTAEDEFAYILTGAATLIDDDGEHALGPGDAVCWPHGCPNAHHLINRGAQPCDYLIVGTRVAHDICHYPDDGHKQVNGDTRWHVEDAQGAILRAGELPPALMNLPPVWGTPFDPTVKTERILRAIDAVWHHEPNPTHPILGSGPGPYAYRPLGDPGGLSQFGAFIERLPPGSRSGFRHWHETEDEMVYVLSGAVTLIEAVESSLRSGDAVTWAAGHSIGHCLENRSQDDTTYLVIGTRQTTDTVHYPDHDLITRKDGTSRNYLTADGRDATQKGADA